jgi:hypothetical protein
MKAHHVAALLSLTVGSMAFGQQAVQWKVSDGGNGHWYAVRSVPQGITWTAARDQCAPAGGHLATTTSSEENAFCFGLVPPASPVWAGTPTSCDTCCACGGPWLGGYQDPSAWEYSEPTGGWRWVTDEPWAFVAWYGPVTDDGNGNRESHLQFWRSFLFGAWNDNEDLPNRSTGYIIEWSADCNGDGIVDYGQCRDGSLPDYNGNNIPDCCEQGIPCVVGSYPVQWQVSEGGNGHWYQLRATNDSRWETAQAQAESIGGHLATPTSAGENLHMFIVAGSPSGKGAFFGGFKNEQGQCEWVTGEPFDFTSWDSGEPNGGLGEPFLHFKHGPVWNDVYSPFISDYVAEWSADCNNDGIVDKGQILTGQLADSDNNGVPDVCQAPSCRDADFFRDFNVNGADLGILLSQWGPNTPFTVSDLTGDGAVNGDDLGIFLSYWGPCPD